MMIAAKVEDMNVLTADRIYIIVQIYNAMRVRGGA